MKKLLMANQTWLRPKPQPFSYSFTMKHAARGDRSTATVSYADPDYVTVRRDGQLLHEGPVNDNYDPNNSAWPPQLLTVQQGVTLFGPMQELAMFPETGSLRMLGEETVGGETMLVLQLKRADRVGADVPKPFDDSLRKAAERPEYLYEFSPVEREAAGEPFKKVEIELKCVYAAGPGWPEIVAAHKANPSEIRWGGKLITLGRATVSGEGSAHHHPRPRPGVPRTSPVTKTIFNGGVDNMTPKLGLGEGKQVFDPQRYQELKSDPSALPLPMRVGCGIWGSWYGYSGGGADVDQIWVQKATGRVMCEEGFWQGKCRFAVHYSNFESLAGGQEVPRRVIVCSTATRSSPPGCSTCSLRSSTRRPGSSKN